MSACQLAMYAKLIESYLSWLEYRGSQGTSAQVAATFAFSSAAVGNLVAALLLLEMLGGPQISAWIAERMWVTFVLGLVILIAHVRLIDRLMKSAQKEDNTHSHTKRYLWSWYAGATLIFLIVIFALTLDTRSF